MITPGSMFDVDIVLHSSTSLYVAAAGKAVHANTMGDGGDLYLFTIKV